MYIIWLKPNNQYYYRLVKGTYKNYYVGYKNQYDHEIILIISCSYKKKFSNPIKRNVRRFLYWLYLKV